MKIDCSLISNGSDAVAFLTVVVVTLVIAAAFAVSIYASPFLVGVLVGVFFSNLDRILITPLNKILIRIYK